MSLLLGVTVLLAAIMIMPSVMETHTLDFKTCDALQHLIIRHTMNRDQNAPSILKSMFSSVLTLGSRAFGLGERLAQEKYPLVPPVFGCVVIYWKTQTKIMTGFVPEDHDPVY